MQNENGSFLEQNTIYIELNIALIRSKRWKLLFRARKLMPPNPRYSRIILRSCCKL